VTNRIAIRLQGRGDDILHPGISTAFLTPDEQMRRTVFPSCHSTTNLCCNMTRSRSPASYFIKPSRRAHNVSRRFPALGCTFSEEKNPIHRNPEMIRLASSSSGNLTNSLMRAMRSLGVFKFQLDGSGSATHVSEAEEAPMAFWVTSAQVKSPVNHSFVVASSQPRSTRALMNSGKPWYLRVPRTTVSASGMLYHSLNGTESRFG